jgi:hypothetical protein
MMNHTLTIEFPKDADDFEEGMILLDEAVGRFMHSDKPGATCLERVISAIVREFDGDLRGGCV